MISFSVLVIAFLIAFGGMLPAPDNTEQVRSYTSPPCFPVYQHHTRAILNTNIFENAPTTNESLKAIKQLLVTVPATDVTIDGFSYAELHKNISTLLSEADQHYQHQSNQIDVSNSKLVNAQCEIQICRKHAADLTKELEVSTAKNKEMQADIKEMSVYRQKTNAILAKYDSDARDTVPDKSA